MTASPFLWRIGVQVPRVAVAAVEEALQPACMAVLTMESDTPGMWRVDGFTGREPDLPALRQMLSRAVGNAGQAPPVTVERLEARDWLADNLRTFPPFRIGRYFIYGSHVSDPPPAGTVAIRLDAGQAFGSGEHASTRGCLLALDRLAKERRFHRPLDLGCGSGILAIAMALTWRVPVVATDIDPVAVNIARQNAHANRVGDLVRLTAGDGYRLPVVKNGGPFDLIVANILAGPLSRMAGDLDRHLGPDGIAVLAGLLERDAAWVTAAHRGFGLRLIRNQAIDGWATLTVGR